MNVQIERAGLIVCVMFRAIESVGVLFDGNRYEVEVRTLSGACHLSDPFDVEEDARLEAGALVEAMRLFHAGREYPDGVFLPSFPPHRD